MEHAEKIVVTGAGGQLGRLVVRNLRKIAPAAQLIGVVRNAAAARELEGLGVEPRMADYADVPAITAALEGADRALLISSSEVGRRVAQHRNVVNAAKAAGVKLFAYTSILHADTNPMALAEEHRETESLIRASGLRFTLLRNGWYTENHTASLAAAIAHGVVLGSAGEGRFSSAARADYAEAAARVIAGDAESRAGRVYELAGDEAYTLSEFAAEISRRSGKPVVYKNLPEDDYKAALQDIGLPEAFAGILAESDVKAANGALFDAGRELSRLLGRPTTTMAESVAKALETA